MKKTQFTILLILMFQIILNAQIISETQMQIIQNETGSIESYPIPGSHVLREKEEMVAEYYARHPELQINRLAKTAWNFTVGSTYTWWADYLADSDSGDQQYQVPSTCRAVGNHCYVFVEDAVWGTNRVDQSAVDAIVEAFDNTTPADAPYNDGIFNVDTRVFGDPPDVDNDPKIIILILDIKDGYDGSGGYVAGYFYSLNQQADSGEDGTRSNEAEIFYMDCNPADLITDRTDVLNTTAHEFQHMIHWNWDNNEITFVNEGCSEIAAYICGYGLRSNNLYAQNPNVNLLSWDTTPSTLDDYSRAAHWTLYIYEQFGIDILRDFVVNSYPSWVNFDATFSKYSNGTRDFRSVYKDFLIANYLNNTSIDPKYGYTYSPITSITPTFYHVGNLNASNTGSVANQGANYITFSGGSDLNINFSQVDGTLRFCAVKTGNPTEIDDITITNNSGSYTPSGYGDPFTTATLIIFNVHTDGNSESYTYTSTGTGEAVSMELAYEDGISDGSFGLATGDSIAVIFTGVQGAKLDSIKTFFAGTGRIIMSLTEHDGTNFLHGPALRTPSQLNISDNSDWYKIDLSTSNIDASNDFVVSYALGNDPSNPNILVRAMPDDGEFHSRTFTDQGGGAQWWIFHDGGTPQKYWNYLIRAYVSIGGGTVAIDPSGIVSIPKDFSLGTNYPNPFNPSTTFDFTTPNDGLVKFTVYDLLGQVIYSENRNLFAGKYSFTWDGKNQLDQQVVSGVYFLKMEAEGFTQTRKMLMMK